MGTMAGWLSILLALFAAAIGIVPGAASLMGLAISMSAVVLSLFSVKANGKKYFGVTTALALSGAFLSNDALRIWAPIPMPSHLRLGMSGVMLLVLAICSFAAYRLDVNPRIPARS
jgi:hypothetical protein